MEAPIKIESPKIPQVFSETQRIKSAKFWERTSKISLYLLIFLLPLFFLPGTADVLDFNKQILLVSLVFISLFGWFLKSLAEGKINFKLQPLNLPVAIFLLILGLSTIFSAYSYGSFWGWPLDIAPSFLTALCFILLYFLIVNIFQRNEIFRLFFILIASSFLVVLFGLFQLFGKFIFPFDFAKISSFNTIGTVNSLGIYLACLLPLIICLIFISQRLIRFLLMIFGAALLFLLFIINFWAAWIALLIGSAIILIFGLSKGGAPIFSASWLTLPIFILAIALFFGFLRIALPGLPATPLEVSPAPKTTLEIALQTLKESPQSLFLGSGPGTFGYNYSKFKPEEINQTPFWAVRFPSGASEILDKLGTTGILGFLSFLGILGLFLWLAFSYLLKEANFKSQREWIFNLGVFGSWLGIVAGYFLYPVNLSLGFLFWFFTAGFIAFGEGKLKSWNFEPSSKLTLRFSFLFVFFLILGLYLFFFTGQRYLAEARYLQALEAVQRGDNQGGINYLLKAISHTGGKQDNYWRDISQVYLLKINQELLRRDIPQEEIWREIIPLVSSAVDSAKTATDLAPKNVANWAVRGFIYSNLINVIGGADQWAIKSYQKAIELEPTNPFLYTELGRVYLRKGEIEKAREKLQKSLDLKPDYPPAHFLMAMIYVQEGKTQEAISKLEATKEMAPFDQGLAFQLGLIYYHDNQFDKAKEEFKRAINLDPNYSNARYFLGLIYDRENKKDLAIEQFVKIEELNPENQEVKKILANLRAGKPALEGILPGQPPIEERPPERL